MQNEKLIKLLHSDGSLNLYFVNKIILRYISFKFMKDTIIQIYD